MSLLPDRTTDLSFARASCCLGRFLLCRRHHGEVTNNLLGVLSLPRARLATANQKHYASVTGRGALVLT